ncbi:MAG: NAD(P)/FAD-dependent oxidoreductase [Planctomycetaceae bacterium]|jgi:flavin-dependent dehydrogenase
MIAENRSLPLPHDVVIVGGGPAASFTALFLLKHGIQPLIVERDSFPRFHIGESLTGEVGGILRELGLEAELASRQFPIKHGVTVYGANGTNTFWVPVMRRQHDGDLTSTTTWQVRRDEFDQFLLETAVARGATVVKGDADGVLRDGDAVCGLRVKTAEGLREFPCRILVDASGQKTFLANQGVTGPKERGSYEKQVGIFSRVTGAVRDLGEAAGNTLIFYQEKHHWSWFIPLSETETSIGVVVPGEHFSQSGKSTEEFLEWKLRNLNPALTARLQNIEFTEPVRTASNYSYHVKNFTGPGFVCVGDSHRFTDPIFSFGVFFSANEAKMAAAAIRDVLANGAEHEADPFAEYEATCDFGQQVIQDVIDFFWEYPLAFQMMAHKSHKGEITDCFAGRVYPAHQPSEAVLTMRRMLARVRTPQPEPVA